jgi:hypothetical protein
MPKTLVKNTQAAAGVNAGVSTGSNVGASGVLPLDSGNITTANSGNGSLTVKYVGAAGVAPAANVSAKLTDGTQQSATTQTDDATAGVDGNFIGAAEDATYRGNAKGYSILGE